MNEPFDAQVEKIITSRNLTYPAKVLLIGLCDFYDGHTRISKSEISIYLAMPMNTLDRNLQILRQRGLVEPDYYGTDGTIYRPNLNNL